MKRQRNESVHMDPVCGMALSYTTAIELFSYDGKTYYCCSTDCREAFEADPEKYIRHHRQHGKGPR